MGNRTRWGRLVPEGVTGRVAVGALGVAGKLITKIPIVKTTISKVTTTVVNKVVKPLVTKAADQLTSTAMNSAAKNVAKSSLARAVTTRVLDGGASRARAIANSLNHVTKRHAADVAKKSVKGGIYVVRTVKGKLYVGQSKNVERRLMQQGKISSEAAARATRISVGGGKLAREIQEQYMINRLGGKEV